MRKWIVMLAALASVIGSAARSQQRFVASFTAGTTDADGHVLGGTELRVMAAHGGKLFAGNGYWEDAPGAAKPGPQILVLEQPNGAWRLDHAFADLLPGGRRRHLAISALVEAPFSTDANGAALPAPARLLLASTWDVTGTRTVFVRNDRTGEWDGTILAQDKPQQGFLPQIRAFGTHRDRFNGADLVFAGDTRGIFAGAYDHGRVAWRPAPEFAVAQSASDFPGLAGRVRISSFAEAGGRLFAAIGQQIWARTDGAAPGWQLLYTNPQPFYSQTGLRGLTAITGPGGRAMLLAAVEGQRSRIVRIDPDTGEDVTELDVAGLLNAAWGTRVSYVIGAYNDMTRLPGPSGDDLLIGLEAFIPPASPRPPGHTVLDVIHGLEAGGWFLLRHPDGRYELRQVTGLGRDLVAIRAAAVFPGQPDAVFVGGYDANGTVAHDTAWIAQGRP